MKVVSLLFVKAVGYGAKLISTISARLIYSVRKSWFTIMRKARNDITIS